MGYHRQNGSQATQTKRNEVDSMTKLLYVIIYAILFTFTMHGLAAIFNVPTYEVAGPMLIGAVAALMVEVNTLKEGR